jgi:hypothetical protein
LLITLLLQVAVEVEKEAALLAVMAAVVQVDFVQPLQRLAVAVL